MRYSPTCGCVHTAKTERTDTRVGSRGAEAVSIDQPIGKVHVELPQLSCLAPWLGSVCMPRANGQLITPMKGNTMIQNKFKEKIKAGQPVFGFYLGFQSPELVEFMGHAGFDYVFIDAEHFAFGLETTQALARAAELTGMTPIVRVAKNDPEVILGYLETGAFGIIVPHTNTLEEAQAAVRAVKYYPLGSRGAVSSSRAANYGLTQTATEYFAKANRQTVVIALVEEMKGINNLAEILTVEGVDGVSIGAGDLAMSMGFPGEPNHPQVRELVEKARAQIRASDKALGATVTTAEAAKKALADGALYITLSLGTILGQTVRDFLVQAKG
jgi:4-hydroxy-2-oxoheptanedioate aldolase